MSDYENGYAEGLAEGRRNTAREMAKAALKVENRLRRKIDKLQQTVDYLKTCVSCADFNCQKRCCILQDGACANFNKWRMPE